MSGPAERSIQLMRELRPRNRSSPPIPLPAERTLRSALAQHGLSPAAIDFIQRHMLMEEKRALLRFLANPTQTGRRAPIYKSLRAFAQLYGRREDLLLTPLAELLLDGIITLQRAADDETLCALTDDAAQLAVIREALAAYDRSPELRRILAAHTAG